MARLKLKPGVNYRDIGYVISDMATEAKSSRTAIHSEHLDQLRALIDENKEAVLDVVPNWLEEERMPRSTGNSVYLNVHFDRTIDHGGHKVRVVNIVVPDFDGKISKMIRSGKLDTSTNDLGAGILDLNDVAMEAFGFVVICGCAG